MIHPKDILISAILVYVIAIVGTLLGTGLAIVGKANFNEYLIIKGLFSWLFAGFGYYYCIKTFETNIFEKLSFVVLVVFLMISFTDMLFGKWSIFSLLILVVHAGIAISSYGFYKSYYVPKLSKNTHTETIDSCNNCGVKLIIGEYDQLKLSQLKQSNIWVIGRYDRSSKENWNAVLISSSAKKCPKCGEILVNRG